MLRSDCLEPNGENASDAELLVAMEAAPNKRSYRRLAAMRALLRGWPRAEVAQVFGRSERMVRLWILAFNSGGIDALASKPRPGRPRKVKLERVRDLLVPVLEEPGKAGQRHWTGVKLHGWLKEQLCLELAIAPSFVICISSITTCASRSAGPSGRMKLSAKLSSSAWRSCGRIPQPNCGMATSAGWKAIRDRAGAGRHAAAARACPT